MEVLSMNRSLWRAACLVVFAVTAGLQGQDPAPGKGDPTPAKGPDKEVAEQVDLLKAVVLDKKCARDEEGVQAIDVLLQKLRAGVEPKDQQAILKALDGVFSQGKLRERDNIKLYVAAAAALGTCGVDGAKSLKNAYTGKRIPAHRDWVPLREVLLRQLGKTKDESQIKFFLGEARGHHEPALQAAAGEALGNFEDAKESLRKDIVGTLIAKWGEIEELASQLGPGNVEAQNAQERRAAVADKWGTTLEKLTRQNLRKFTEWQQWYNKNKGQPWP